MRYEYCGCHVLLVKLRLLTFLSGCSCFWCYISTFVHILTELVGLSPVCQTSLPWDISLKMLARRFSGYYYRITASSSRQTTTWSTGSLLRLLVHFPCPQLPPRWGLRFLSDHNDSGISGWCSSGTPVFTNELDLGVRKEFDIYKLESQLENSRSSSRQFCLSAIYYQGVAPPIFRWCYSSL